MDNISESSNIPSSVNSNIHESENSIGNQDEDINHNNHN